MSSNDAMHAFRRQLAAQGFFKRATAKGFYDLAIFIAATLVGIGLLFITEEIAVRAVAMWLITLGGMGMTTNAHTASHNAISDKLWVNKALTYFGYPFFLQVSVSYWRHKHLVVHHPNPNVAGVDDDADLMPFFALTEEDARNGGAWRRALYRWQVLVLPFALAFNAFNVVRTGWMFLIGKLLDRKQRRPEHWVDLAMLLLHYAVWVGLPMYFLPPMHVIAFNLVRFTLMSYGMFALFAPAHYPAEAAMVAPDEGHDFVALQTLTTVNFRTGWLGRLICGGVEYQIEHHLFPSISPAHYPRLCELVRDYCERHGLPYRSQGWGAAIWKSLIAFTELKPVYSSLKEVPHPAQTSPAERSLAKACLEVTQC